MIGSRMGRAVDSRRWRKIGASLARGGILTLIACWPLFAHGERINHEGRALGPAPVVKTPLLFNTPAADAVVAAMGCFEHLNGIGIGECEVIQTTGPNQGPRAR